MSTDLTLKAVCKKLDRPVHTSFLKMLCDRGQIEHSRLPGRSGRENDLYLIPEDEVDHIKQILFESAKEIDLTATPKDSGRYLSTAETAKILGYTTSNVGVLRKKNLIKFRKNGKCFEHEEKSVLEYKKSKEEKVKEVQENKNVLSNDLLSLALENQKKRSTELVAKVNRYYEELKTSKKTIEELERSNKSIAKQRDEYIKDFDILKAKYESVKKDIENVKAANKYLSEKLGMMNEELDKSSFKDGYKKCRDDVVLMVMNMLEEKESV